MEYESQYSEWRNMKVKKTFDAKNTTWGFYLLL